MKTVTKLMFLLSLREYLLTRVFKMWVGFKSDLSNAVPYYFPERPKMNIILS